MTNVVIDARDAERLARSFTKSMARRALTKAINAGGRSLRMGMPPAIEAQAGAKRGAIKRGSRARAAYAGSETPQYRLEMPGAIPVTKLKSVKGPRRAKTGKLSFRSGFQKRRTVFSSAEVEGQGKTKAFSLTPARGLRRRFVGGTRLPRDLFTNASYAGIQAELRSAVEASAEAFQLAVATALQKKRRA